MFTNLINHIRSAFATFVTRSRNRHAKHYTWVVEPPEDSTLGTSCSFRSAKKDAKKAATTLSGVSKGWTCEIYHYPDCFANPSEAKPIYLEAYVKSGISLT